MKALVTGAPGWLGNRLVDRLSKKVSVRCLVLPGMNTKELEGMGAEISYGNITDPQSLDKATNGTDVVFHCAGIIHPKKAADFYTINRDGTANMLEAAAKNNVKRFVYVSSNSAQGTNVNRRTLMTEEGPCRPYTDYGKSKYEAEQVVKKYNKDRGLDTVIIRPCWFYGPGQPDRMTKLMKMIKKGKPLIFGNGLNLRSMSFVDNVVHGLLLAAQTREASGQTYWIADGRPYRTIEIYLQIADLLGADIKPRFVPGIVSSAMEKADIMLGKLGKYSINIHVAGEMTRDIACSIEKARKELKYEPKVSLKEGMQISIDWAEQKGLL